MDDNKHELKNGVCSKCKWEGTQEQTLTGEVFEHGFEFLCPKCHYVLGFKPYSWAVPGNPDYVPEKDPDGLTNVDQLPELDSDEIIITLNEEDRHFVLRFKDKEIWREKMTNDYHNIYPQLGEILIQKYGNRLADFVPPEHSNSDYFATISAAIRVSNCRQSIKDNYNP